LLKKPGRSLRVIRLELRRRPRGRCERPDRNPGFRPVCREDLEFPTATDAGWVSFGRRPVRSLNYVRAKQSENRQNARSLGQRCAASDPWPLHAT
jgi:hypothetical protein